MTCAVVDGKEGLPPSIPPDTSIMFDVTLLGFRPRSVWVKPLIQDSNTTEKPYHIDRKITTDLANASSALTSGGGIDENETNDNASMSTALGGRSTKVSINSSKR